MWTYLNTPFLLVRPGVESEEVAPWQEAGETWRRLKVRFPSDIKAGLVEFAALVSNNLKRISFENKQKLLRIVLEKIVVKDWRVDVFYNIPLPKPTPTPGEKVSTKFDLRSACR